jgi:cobalt-zinc-cadmium efflux system outer membrane protein
MNLKHFIFWLVMLMIVTAAANAGNQDEMPLVEPESVLSLIQALQLAYQHNPELAISEGAIRAGEARIIQARLLPNPELSAEAENIWGRDAYSGFDEAESTLTIGQPLELGGKRSKRTSLAETERYLAEWDYKSLRLELTVEVTKSFIGVLAGQQRLKVKGEIVSVAENSAAAVTARVEAGKVSPIEQTSAEIRVANARNAMMQAQTRLQGERKRLSTLWGNPAPIFTEAVGDLGAITPPPPLEALVELLPQNPRLARWEEEDRDRTGDPRRGAREGNDSSRRERGCLSGPPAHRRVPRL